MVTTLKKQIQMASIDSSLPENLLLSSVIVLICAVLLYPVHFRFVYAPIESTSIFVNLSAFEVIYASAVILIGIYVWLYAKASVIKATFSSVAFALVYLGSYIAYSRPASVVDYEAGGLAFVHYLLGTGTIPNLLNSAQTITSNFGYFEYPFTSIVGAILSDVAGLSVIQFRTLYLFFTVIALTLFLFAALLRRTRSPFIAFLGVAIAFQANEIVGGVARFLPSGQAFLFLGFFIFLLFRSRWTHVTWPDYVCWLVFLAAVATVHLPTAVAFLFIFGGVTFVIRLTGGGSTSIDVVLVLFVTIITTWLVYVAYFFFSSLVTYNLIGSFNDLGSLFSIQSRAAAYFGPQLPFWAGGLRAFWLVLLFLPSALITLKRLVFRTGLDHFSRTETGALLGVAVFTLLAIASSSVTGGNQFYRFLTYASFFVVPVLLVTIQQSRYAKIILVLFFIMTLGLSLPTYFAHNPHPDTSQFLPQDYSASNFLNGTIRATTLMFVDPDTYYLLLYNNPTGAYAIAPYPPTFVNSSSQFPAVLHTYYNSFRHQSQTEQTVFVYSPRITLRYEDWFGISPSNVVWLELRQNLNTFQNTVYNNGFVDVYQ